MYDPIAALRTLVLPFGQPANSPQVLINVDPVPAAIVAYYAANGAFAAPETVVSIPLLAQKDSSNYIYTSLNIDTAGEMYYCHGTVDSVNGVNETWRELVPFGFRTGIIYGALPSAGSITQVQYGLDQAQQTAALIINRSSSYTIDGIDAPRGNRLILAGGPAKTSGGAGTGAGAESAAFSGWTAGDTGNSMIFRDGRVYRMLMTAAISNNGGWTAVLVRFKSSGGTTLGTIVDTIPDNGHLDINTTQEAFVYNNSGADITTGIITTVARSACQVGGAVVAYDGALVDIEDYASVNKFASLGFGTQVVA